MPIGMTRIGQSQTTSAATQRHWQARLHYTYLERDESRRRIAALRLMNHKMLRIRARMLNRPPAGLRFESFHRQSC